MKQQDLADSVARANHQSAAEARDEIDELAHKILRSLERGEPVELPGVGKLVSTAPKRKPRRKRK